VLSDEFDRGGKRNGTVAPVLRWKHMSGETFDEVFRREYPSVLRTVALILMSKEVAEEVTQEAFAQLHLKWGRVADMDKPGAWVRRVAIRAAVRRRRRTLQGAVLEISQLGRDPDDVKVDVDVLRAVAALPRQQRAAVVLRYYEDLPVADVASALGCAEATVRVHLHRARLTLAERLGVGEETGDVAR
jgi:RNA polymerase sigma-70 factor (ECF subfamily)